MIGRPPPASPQFDSEKSAARQLVRQWRWWAAAGVAALAAAALALRPAFGSATLLWFVVNLPVLGGVLALVRRWLPRNRRSPDGLLLAEMGAGNQATILRGILLAQLPGYLLFPWPAGWQAWMPALTFSLSLTADYLDGYLARRADRVTALGEALDIEFDGLGLLAATALAVHYGQLPLVYFATVGCARYLYLAAGWLASRAGRRLAPLPPSAARRGLAGVTMEVAAAALWPILPAVMMTLAAAIVAVPFLAGFGRDAAIHLGFVDPASKGYQRLRRALVGLATVVLPPVLRAAILLLLGPLWVAAAKAFPETVATVAAAGLQAPGAFTAIVLLVGLVSLILIGLGFAGRTGAAAIVVVYGLGLSLVAVDPRSLAGWGCAFAIYIFGTGPASLWQPERSLYLGKAGERR